MKNNLCYFVIFAAIFVAIKAGELPFGIKKCKKDATFDDCALKMSKECILNVVEGDPKFNAPPLKSLKIPFVQLEASKMLKLNLTDIVLSGLETSSVLKLHSDFDKQTSVVVLHIKKIEINANYDIDGRILILPIKGQGKGNIQAHDGNYTYFLKYKFIEKNGVKYGQIAESELTFKLKKAVFKLDNLFNGDKMLGEQMNNFLNENWEDVINDFGPLISKTVIGVVNKLANDMFSQFPFDDMFEK